MCFPKAKCTFFSSYYAVLPSQTECKKTTVLLWKYLKCCLKNNGIPAHLHLQTNSGDAKCQLINGKLCREYFNKGTMVAVAYLFTFRKRSSCRYKCVFAQKKPACSAFTIKQSITMRIFFFSSFSISALPRALKCYWSIVRLYH